MKAVSKLASGVALAIAALAFSPSMGSAWIPDLDNPDKLTAKAEKFAFKNLTDIYKQGIKNVFCVVKATSKCRYKEAAKAGEDPAKCKLSTWDTLGADIPKFTEAVAKCNSKNDFSKKQPKDLTSAQAYEAFACPGDKNGPGAPQVRYDDLDDYQTGDGLRATLIQIDVLADLVEVQVNADATVPAEDKLKQSFKDGGTLNKYAYGIGKATLKCESDAKDKKGNGATTDSATACCAGDPGMDPNFAAAVTKEVEKMEKKLGPAGGRQAFLIGQIDTAYCSAAQTSWNHADNCAGPVSSPSGAFLDGGARF